MSVFAEPPLLEPIFDEWAEDEAFHVQIASIPSQSNGFMGLPWSTSSGQESGEDVFRTFSTPQKARGPRQPSDFWTQSRRAMRDEAATTEAFHRKLRASTSQPDLLSLGCYPSPPLPLAPPLSKSRAQIPDQSLSRNVSRSWPRSPCRNHDAVRGRPTGIVKPAVSRRTSASPSKLRNARQHQARSSPSKPRKPASADRSGTLMMRDANTQFDDHGELRPSVAHQNTTTTASICESQLDVAVEPSAYRKPILSHKSGKLCTSLSNVPLLAISSASNSLTEPSGSAYYEFQFPDRQFQPGSIQPGPSNWSEIDPFYDDPCVAEAINGQTSHTQDDNAKLVSELLHPNADACYDLFPSDLRSDNPLWQLQHYDACAALTLGEGDEQADRLLGPLIESGVTAFPDAEPLWDPLLSLEDYPGWPPEQVGSDVDSLSLFADFPNDSGLFNDQCAPGFFSEGLFKGPLLSGNIAFPEPAPVLCTEAHTTAQQLPMRDKPTQAYKPGTSPSKQAIVERQVRARTPSPTKAHTRTATSSRGAVKPQFVNFTAEDSGELLRGVAPSGSNKTKAKREKEAAAQQRRIHEAAVQAVLEVGGNVERLRRMRLS